LFLLSRPDWSGDYASADEETGDEGFSLCTEESESEKSEFEGNAAECSLTLYLLPILLTIKERFV